MATDRDRDLARICQSALERPAEQRSAFLLEACGGDDELRLEAESLLARDGQASSFLETPVLADAAHGLGNPGPTLTIGDRVGPYTIVSPLGAGGMGEVYRARDDGLRREVAVKILPATFTNDPERLARFEREALVLASLNHPNIATIHGIEHVAPIHALVLELVEGETLGARLLSAPRRGSPGALPLPSLLSIARQIAEGLEAAHEKGVVHRDLKPANVMIRPDGLVKVLDFGLAKPATSSPADVWSGATLTAAPSRLGTIVGTPAYMSPEQARGEHTDTRTDIWAFGCVLFEMLTGRRTFEGRTVPDTIAAVLEREPDWALLPDGTPAPVSRLLVRCLHKDPRRRLQHIGDARIEIDDALTNPGSARPALPHADVGVSRRRMVQGLSLVAVAVAAAVAGYSARARPEPAELRLDVTAPPTTDAASLAISPDGRLIAFVGSPDGQPRLWLRSLDGTTARPLSGTENAKLPFWSPDNRSIGFTSNGELKRIDVESGFVQSLTRAEGGGTWGRDGTILFDRGPGGDIFRVSAAGGEPSRVTNLGTGSANDAWSPWFLPDERHFLFVVTGLAPGIYVGELGGSGQPRRLLDAQAAVFAPPGRLFFVRQRTLFAQAFDAASLQLTGSPTTVAEQVVTGPGVSSALAVSAAGVVVFRAGGGDPQSQFAWFDRSGKKLAAIADSVPGDGFNSSMSPDGRHLAFSSFLETPKGRTADVWVLDLERGVPSLFTSDALFDLCPVWAPDSRTIAFASNRARSDGSSQSFDVYLKPIGGAGREEFLVGHEGGDPPSDWSADGRFILYNRSVTRPNGVDQSDVWAVSLDGERRPFPVVATEFLESNAQFSPDGKWVAYQSNESGRSEIYLQPFPGPGARTRVSADGGDQVRWRRDGRELFFLTLDDRLTAVPVQFESKTGTASIGAPITLFASPLSGTPRHGFGRHYSVSRDGQRFLMDVRKEVTLPITVLLNWRPRRE